MRVITMAAVLLLLAAPIAWAGEDGLVRGGGSAPAVTSAPGLALLDAWNDAEPPGTSTYGVGCFGFTYTPLFSYTLQRIEWFCGNIGGEVTTQIRSGGFNGPVLGSATYQEVPPRSWQGQDLDAPASLQAGTTYYIVYDAIPGALATIATSGTIIPHYPSGDCVSFSGPFSTSSWMARFYGVLPVSVDSDTWGRIKSTYR